MSQISSIPPKTTITVNAQGTFIVNGKPMDMIGLIFKFQKDLATFAQHRLQLTAQELWEANDITKKAIFFLDKIRALRPSGKATDKASSDDINDACTSFGQTFGKDPFYVLGVEDLKPDWDVNIYKADEDYKLQHITKDGTKWTDHAWSSLHFQMSIPDQEIAQMAPGVDHLGLPEPGSPMTIKKIKTYKHQMKQAEIDQLIEGLKSKISNVGSQQELLQTDAQRFTRLSDETKEDISSNEKAIYNFVIGIGSNKF